MKKCYTIILLCLISAVTYSQNFHWVGPSGGAGGNWTDGNNWSLTSGGPSAGDWPKDASDDAIFDQNALVNLNSVANFQVNSIQVILNRTATLFTNTALDITVNSNSPGDEGLRIDAGSTLRDSVDANVNFRIVFGGTSAGEVNGDFFLGGNPAFTASSGSSFAATPGSLTVGNGGRVILRPKSGLLQGTTSTLFFASGSQLVYERDGSQTPAATYHANSIIRIVGNTNQATRISGTPANVGNVEYECAGLTTQVAMGLTTANIQGYLKILNTNNQVLAIMTNPGPTSDPVTLTVGGNMEVSGTSVVAITTAGLRPVNLQINGNYVQSGGVFSLQQDAAAVALSKLLLKGNYSQTGGTFTANSTATNAGTNLFVLEMNGTTAQTFSSAAGTIDNLTHQVALRLNNPNHVTLNSPLAVGRVDFASGRINTTIANALTITNSDNNPIDINGVSNSSYVEGPVKRRTALTTAYKFPVGKNGSYRFCEVIPTSTSASEYAAEYFDSGYPQQNVLNPLTGVANNQYWDIMRLSGSNAAIRLTLSGAVPNAQAGDAVVVAHFTGGVWVSEKGSSGTMIVPGNSTSGSCTSQTLTSFSPFTFGFGPSGALPIRLDYFTASKGSGFNSLQWKADCFSTQAVFEIERSYDGRSFSKIQTVVADQLRCLQPFDYKDFTATQGTVYYRVRIVDVDGTGFYSRIVALMGKSSGFEIVGVYPTLVTAGQLKVNVASSSSSKVEFNITNASGQMMRKFNFTINNGENILTLNLSDMAAGVYQITGFNSDGQMRTFRFIKQ